MTASHSRSWAASPYIAFNPGTECNENGATIHQSETEIE
jgi:hypothetical protein